VLAKNKNIMKDRPTVPCTLNTGSVKFITCAPGRSIMCAPALSCLPSTKTRSQHTLWKTQGLVPNLQKFNKHFTKSLKHTQSQGKIVLTGNGNNSQM
jgi:hypothetical protein